MRERMVSLRLSWVISVFLLVAVVPASSLAPDTNPANVDAYLVLSDYATYDVIYVDADASGANNGTSWEDAFNSLQDGLDAVLWGDEILVADGNYVPDTSGLVNPREATFQLQTGVALYGGYAGWGAPDPNERNIELYETILSGDLDANDIGVASPADLLGEPTRCDNSYHVVAGSGTDETALLDGFTITGGNGNGSYPDDAGGGMFNSNGSPRVVNCTFSGNSANGARWYGGAGVYNGESSNPILTNCTFSGNATEYCGGGVNNQSNSGPELNNCAFTDNWAGRYGGGMYNRDSSSPMLTNCKFSGNSTGDSDNEDNGGAMRNVYDSNPALTNCTFRGNSAKDLGGAMANDSSSPILTNCTFSGNSALIGGGLYNEDSDPNIINCILWGNTASSGGNEISNDPCSIPVISYCDISGSGSWDTDLGTDGGGNIDADPLFVDPNGPDGIIGTGDDNLRLSPGSPCIDDANNIYVPAGVTEDLDGRDRIVDGDCDLTATVDMGAYEFAWIYIGDFDGDCNVDLGDFGIFALAWLTEEGEGEYNPDCDISNPADDTIDMLDAEIVFRNWLAGR